ncbi:MAG: GNAT family N-acetyltransferase [Frankiaceae bacterium]|nr:GNAT family N-acetyltransferase [Arenimonas sp.]
MTENNHRPAAAVVVRAANAGDVSLMARWAEAMAFETENKQLDLGIVSRGITIGVADPARSLYFMADIDGEPVGTLMFTFEWSDWRCAWWWWIQSVYVAPAHRRKGVYRALYAHVLEMAKARTDVCGLRLYVERENANAQRTYESLGMVDSGYRMYEAETQPSSE